MKPCKQVRSSFLEALYNELDQDAKQIFNAHLASCIKCRKAFRRMKRTMGVMNQRVRVEPDQQFWDGYWNRLEKRMQQTEKPVVVSPMRWQQWAYRAAAVVLLIGAGVLLGRLWVPSQETQVVVKTETPPVHQAGLDRRTEQFLGRSEVLLLGLVNYDPETDEASSLDLVKQKSISKNLIQEATYLKKELADTDDRRLEKLVSDLELILLQIANLEEKEDLPEIELVKNGVDRKGLLLKINLEQMRPAKSLPKTRSSASGKTRI